MGSSKRYARHGLQTILLFASLWGSAIAGVQAQNMHEESLEQATGAGTVGYARMQYQFAAYNEQRLKEMERQAAAARFRRNALGLFVVAGIVFYIVRQRSVKGRQPKE